LLLAALAGCTQQQNSQDPEGANRARNSGDEAAMGQALAAGISESWSRDEPLDLNSATREQLVSLPGVTGAPSLLLAIGKRLRCKPQPAP